MAKFEPRKFMEQAIAVMRGSTAETRKDVKKCPKVGAVLLKADGTIETACRGELRDGDHAEYTLIERKNRDQNLKGAILFATLEPCALEARNPPKLACAQRIVLARIRQVWIGIEDPDPTVDRKGIKYLQENGVTVHMFDRDLQTEILSENWEFVEQAKERAEEQAKAPKAVSLSTLEEAAATASLTELSETALERYRAAAGVPDRVGSEPFNRRLLRHGLVREVDGELIQLDLV